MLGWTFWYWFWELWIGFLENFDGFFFFFGFGLWLLPAAARAWVSTGGGSMLGFFPFSSSGGFLQLAVMMPKISPINCTVLARSYWHLHNEKKESLRSAPVWYRPNTLRRSSQNYSHYSRVLERVKSCVPFFARVLGFYSSRAGPFFLGVDVFSL